jgi:peptide/nickel transport system permease protein
MRFRRYALERIGASVGVFCLAVVGTFVICHVFGPMSLAGGTFDPDVRARLAHYGNESFFDYLSRLFSGSLAQSIYGGRNPPSVPDASLVTLSLVGWAIFIGLLIAVPLGLLWDWRPRWTRVVAWPFVYLAASMLTLWVALELSFYFGFKWNIFPVANYANFFGAPKGSGLPGGPIEWAYHLILPAFVLCLPFAAIYTRVVRASARNVRRARADAPAEERDAAGARARRAGLVTIAKGLLRDVGWLMGLALFVEISFSLPGLGRALQLATVNADTPVMESVLIFGTLVAVGIHLLGALIGGAVSPRWRAGA